nr:hypothetical protein [Tanacetum cinerariifolium]
GVDRFCFLLFCCGSGFSKAYLITHLRDSHRHCKGEALAITKHSLLTDLVVFERAELDQVDGLLHDQHDGFTLSLLDSLFSKGLRTVKTIPLKCRLSFSRVLKGALDKGVPGGGIRPIAVGTVWRRLVSKVSATVVGHSLDGYLDDLHFGVGVSRWGSKGYARGSLSALPCYLTLDEILLFKPFQLILQRTHPMVMPRDATGGSSWSFTFFLSVISPDLEGSRVNCRRWSALWAVNVDFGYSSELVMKRVSKTIVLMDVVAKINDPQCDGFESAQRSFDVALRSALERIVTASEPGFGDWQWRLATLPFAFRGLGIYSTCDVLNYAFLASRLYSAALQTKLLRHVGIVAYGSTFDDALSVFNTSIEIDFLSYPSGFVAISKGAPHLSLASGGFDFRIGTDYERDTYGDNAVSCADILAGKEVDIGLGGGCDKALRPADILLYSWDRGLDVYVDLTGSSPLTRTWMADFVPGRAVTEAAQRKRVKYEAKCAGIGYGFHPFSFSSFGELEKDAVTLLKRIRKFFMAQDIGARVAVHIFNRISFSIAKELGPR